MHRINDLYLDKQFYTLDIYVDVASRIVHIHSTFKHGINTQDGGEDKHVIHKDLSSLPSPPTGGLELH